MNNSGVWGRNVKKNSSHKFLLDFGKPSDWRCRILISERFLQANLCLITTFGIIKLCQYIDVTWSYVRVWIFNSTWRMFGNFAGSCRSFQALSGRSWIQPSLVRFWWFFLDFGRILKDFRFWRTFQDLERILDFTRSILPLYNIKYSTKL